MTDKELKEAVEKLAEGPVDSYALILCYKNKTGIHSLKDMSGLLDETQCAQHTGYVAASAFRLIEGIGESIKRVGGDAALAKYNDAVLRYIDSGVGDAAIRWTTDLSKRTK